jgi:tRNA(His) guanylyltransferase
MADTTETTNETTNPTENPTEMDDFQASSSTVSPKVTLGDRMKSYEALNEQHVDPKLPWIVRLDGHKFSHFTRGFRKPFDDRIHNCMVAACKALLSEFSPTAVYTCSDEITLCYPAFESTLPSTDPEASSSSEGEDQPKKAKKKTEQPQIMMYGGRIQKMATLMAGLASVAFERELKLQVFDPVADATCLKYMAKHPPFFDARIFNVPSVQEIVSNLIWRSHYDYRRNSISQLARSFYSPKEMHKLNSTDLLKKMASEKQTHWDDLPPRYKFGSFFKRQQFKKTVEVNGTTIQATRTRPVEISFCFNKNNDEICNFLTSKFIPEEFQSFVTVTHDSH